MHFPLMAKEQERDELHRTIWQIANDLRGNVDGWDLRPLCWAFSYTGSSLKI